NPGGTPIEAFDAYRAGVAANRAQIYLDVASGPFYGFNRTGVLPIQGVIDNWWRQGMMGGIKAQYDCIKAFSETDLTEDLKAIEVPVLVIHSEDDQIVPYADSAPLAVKLLKRGQLKTYSTFPLGCMTTHPDEIERLARFGHPRSYRAGEMLARIGEPGPGLILILSGRVEVTQVNGGHKTQIVIHERGNFMGELAQLSGRPYLVDEQALTDVEAVTIAPDRLRALLVAEADLGERLMRALILRRVGLIESGAGPIVIGSEQNGDVLRLTNFLRRNGHPYQQLDPANDNCAQTLVERFNVASEELPIVLCPS